MRKGRQDELREGKHREKVGRKELGKGGIIKHRKGWGRREARKI